MSVKDFLKDAPLQDKGLLGHAQDLGVSALKGIVAVPEIAVGLADTVTGGEAGKFLENKGGDFGLRFADAREALNQAHTESYQQQQQRFAQADGAMEKAKYALENPSMVTNNVAESIPSMLFGGLIGRGVMAAAPAVSGALAAGIGEGAAMLGGAAEQIRQQTPDGTLSGGQTAAAIGTGVLGTLFGYGGGRLAKHLGIGDADVMMLGNKPALRAEAAAKLATASPKSIPRQMIEAAATEGFLEELPQSVSEQILQNLALNKEWSDGVDGAAVLGTLAGGAMGGGSGAIHAIRRAKEAPPTAENAQEPPATTEPPAPPAEPTGPLSAAAAIAQRAALAVNPVVQPSEQPLQTQANRLPITIDGEVISNEQPNEQTRNNQPLALAPPPTKALPPPVVSVSSDGSATTTSQANAEIQSQLAQDQARRARIAAGEVTDKTPIPPTPPLSEDRPQLAQRWDALSTSERQQVLSDTQGIPPVISANAPRLSWDKMSRSIQDRIAAALGDQPPAENSVLPQKSAIELSPSDKVTTVFTPSSGKSTQVAYKVVPADSLTISNDPEGNQNPNYPQELQPRDRTRLASVSQIRKMANNLNPSLLSESPTTDTGAPIVGTDGVVESGNGRVAAIVQAYRESPRSASAYVTSLQSQGYDLRGIKDPVLVRVRTQPADMAQRIELARGSNAQQTLTNSSSEQSKSDSSLVPDIIEQYQGGDIDSANNAGFVRSFLSKLPITELASMMDSKGIISQEGKRRIQGAMSSAAYEDQRLISDAFESTDNDIKGISNALVDAAGEWAAFKKAVRAGAIDSRYDITKNLIEAVNLVRQAKSENRSARELSAQGDLVNGYLSPETLAALGFLYTDETLSRQRPHSEITKALQQYTKSVSTYSGNDLLGNQPPPSDVIRAITRHTTPSSTKQPAAPAPTSRAPELDGLKARNESKSSTTNKGNPAPQPAAEAATAPSARSDGETEVTDGMRLVHGSGNPSMTLNDVQIVRKAGDQKQAKKGRYFGGFYATSENDANQAEGYARMMQGEPTLYNIDIKPGTKVLRKKGDITRLSEAYINELTAQGYGLIIGTDPRGRTEYVVIDKNAVEGLSKRTPANQAPKEAAEAPTTQAAPAATDVAAATSEQAPSTSALTDGKTEVTQSTTRLVYATDTPTLTVENMQIAQRTGSKRSIKMGKSPAGIYLSSQEEVQSIEDRGLIFRDTSIYDVDIKPGTKILRKKGYFRHMSERQTNELAALGYSMVIIEDGGRSDYILIDKNAIEKMTRRDSPPADDNTDTNNASPSPDEQSTAMDALEEHPAGYYPPRLLPPAGTRVDYDNIELLFSGDVVRDGDGNLYRAGIIRGTSITANPIIDGVVSNDEVTLRMPLPNGLVDVRRDAKRPPLFFTNRNLNQEALDKGFKEKPLDSKSPPYQNTRPFNADETRPKMPDRGAPELMAEGWDFYKNDTTEVAKSPDGVWFENGRAFAVDAATNEKGGQAEQKSDTPRTAEPKNDEAPRFSFAGKSANYADRLSLDRAKRLAAEGMRNDDILKETGWFRGDEGKWRFEIDDSSATLVHAGGTFGEVLAKAVAAKKSNAVTLRDILNHPRLFAAYPSLASLSVADTTSNPSLSNVNANAAFSEKTQTLYVSPTLKASTLISKLMHEVQHAIQRIEGFATGGSPARAGGKDAYRRLAGEIEARNAERRAGMTADERAKTAPSSTRDTPTNSATVSFNGKEAASYPTPANAFGGAPKINKTSLVGAFNAYNKVLGLAVRMMLKRGEFNKKGGLILIDSADPYLVADAFGKATGRTLDAAIQFFENAETRTIQGMYDKKSGLTFLITPNVDADSALSVVFHESFHGQQRAHLNAKAFELIRSRHRIKDPTLKAFLDEVAERAYNAGEFANPEENAAYIIELAVKRGVSNGYTIANSKFISWVESTIGKPVADILREFLAMVRSWMLRHGIRSQIITVDDLVGYAMHGVSRAALGAVTVSGDRVNFSIKEGAQKAVDYLSATLKTAPGDLSWWHNTVGSMYNLAERHPSFKPVFQSAQRFIDDVSLYAAEPAELASTLLPRLETWRDMLKKPISAQDNKAISAPIFEGTLAWMRDENGNPIETNDVKKAGIVWTDKELSDRFNLSSHQIKLYREFRQAVDLSLDKMALSEMLRIAGKDGKSMRDQIMSTSSLHAAANALNGVLKRAAQNDPERAKALQVAMTDISKKASRAEQLKRAGYAPLSRFGRYTVHVKDGNGDTLYFGMFDTKQAAAEMQKSLQGLYDDPSTTIEQGVVSELQHKLFSGITPEIQELFGEMVGLSSTGNSAQDAAFQEWIKRSKSNRSALRRLIHRKGVAGYSNDVTRVLASFIYSNARHTSASLNAQDIDESVNNTQGAIRDAATLLSEYVRTPQEEGQAIRAFMFAQYLGGSIASAFVNATQPIAVSFPWLSQYGGARLSAQQIGRAAKDIAARTKLSPNLARDMKIAEEDGTLSPQEIHQLMAQARGEGTSLKPGDGTPLGDLKASAGNALSRIMVAWGKPFSAVEQLNRRITYIAAYRIAESQNMKNPDEFARRAVKETQFMYSKAAKMRWGRGAVGGTLMTFKTYSISYLELMGRLWNQGSKGSKERAEGRRAVILMMATLMVMGGAGGLPFSEDVNDLIDGIAQIAGYNVSTKHAKREFIQTVFGKELGEFFERGISGIPGVPLDVSGRLGLGNLIPGTGLLMDSSSHAKDVMEIIGPAGDFTGRVVSGAKSIVGGDIGGGLLEMSPLAIRNAAKGADMASTGSYRDARGYKVLDSTPLEAALKAAGFQPSGVAKIQQANAYAQRAKSFYSLKSNEIKSLWAEGIYTKDDAKIKQARDEVARWNAKNPDQPMIIKVPDVIRRAREMGKSKDTRIAETAPKALRKSLRDELLSVKNEL